MRLLKQVFCLHAVNGADLVLAECSRCHRAILEGISRGERRKVIGRHACLETIETVMNRKAQQEILKFHHQRSKGLSKSRRRLVKMILAHE